MINPDVLKEDLSRTDFSPLFIVGLPRSGTKLLREILNNHKDIFIPISESMFIPYLVKKYGLYPDFSLDKNRKAIITDFCNSTYFYNLSIKRKDIENALFFRILKTNSWQIIFKYILNDLVNNKKNNSIFGDKTPRYLTNLNILHRIYPNAKFLHIIRDPRDQCISARKIWKKSIYRSAQIWKDSIENAREVVLKSNLDYLEVKYEDLLENPEITITEICQYLHCDYSQSMLLFKDSVENYGDAKGLYIIKKDNHNKFKDILSTPEIKKIECIAFTIMKSLKYELINEVNQIDLNPFEQLIYKLHDFIQNYIFHVRQKGFLDGIRYVKSLSRNNISH